MMPLTDDEFWARVFSPEVRAGVTAAQLQIDNRLLAYLDTFLDDPTCEVTGCTGCTDRAVVAEYCRHKGELARLLCSHHMERIIAQWRHQPCFCLVCGHHGYLPELRRFVRIFATRRQA